ncbi:hypothetical protein BU23DRAFT_550177 [Bimuria novae-zelandiae CBS 107.79]|uniref:Uncharacterized protein n=1 Tax=Bimuria novae-zelandiae CBS 107.79 TaxID=1447943 RepID=A0A6A5VK75_9PLEO|nr:hypothetical protein BU23DRAFT_550177 [Bimuria novae-zelandiae CBS 107.79]
MRAKPLKRTKRKQPTCTEHAPPHEHLVILRLKPSLLVRFSSSETLSTKKHPREEDGFLEEKLKQTYKVKRRKPSKEEEWTSDEEEPSDHERSVETAVKLDKEATETLAAENEKLKAELKSAIDEKDQLAVRYQELEEDTEKNIDMIEHLNEKYDSLAAELAAMKKDVANKNRTIGRLQYELDKWHKSGESS